MRLLPALLAALLLAAGCATSERAAEPAPEPTEAPAEAPAPEPTPEPEPAPEAPGFAAVQPLLVKLSPVLANVPGLDPSSWDSLVEGADFGQVLVPFDAAHSFLTQLAAYTDLLSEAEQGTLAAWIDAGAPSPDGRTAYAELDGPYLYVTNQAEAMVSVIDMDAHVVVRNVKLTSLGIDPNARPHHTAVAPDGAHWYVSLIGASEVLQFDRDNTLTGRVPFETPGLLAMHPSGELLYVGRSMMAVNPPQRIGVIDPQTMRIDEVPVFLPRPHALAIGPANEHVYIASLAENRLATLPVGEEDVAELLRVPGPVQTFVQFAVSPDGQTLVTGGQISGKLLFFDLTDSAAPALVDSLDVGGMPWHPVFSPDSDRLYVPNQGTNAVTVVDPAERRIVAVIEGDGLAEPHGAAVSPDGRYLYVSNRNLKSTYVPRAQRYSGAPMDMPADHGGMSHAPAEDGGMMNMTAETNGTVVVIDTATHAIVKVLELGRYPAGMSTRP